jgi:hypothetical protein
MVDACLRLTSEHHDHGLIFYYYVHTYEKHNIKASESKLELSAYNLNNANFKVRQPKLKTEVGIQRFQLEVAFLDICEGSPLLMESVITDAMAYPRDISFTPRGSFTFVRFVGVMA